VSHHSSGNELEGGGPSERPFLSPLIAPADNARFSDAPTVRAHAVPQYDAKPSQQKKSLEEGGLRTQHPSGVRWRNGREKQLD